MRILLAILIATGVFVVAGFLAALWIFSPVPTERDAQNFWIMYTERVIVPGSNTFEAHLAESDIGVHMFSYRYPGTLTSQSFVDSLLSLLRDSEPCFELEEWTDRELLLRCPLPWDPPVSAGFDEYRVLFDAQARAVTVMRGNFDSPAEQGAYRHVVDQLYAFHLEYVRRVSAVPTK